MNLDYDSFLSDLPVGWTFDRLKDVVQLRNERTSDASEIEDYLELEDIESGTGRILNRRNTMEVVSSVTTAAHQPVLPHRAALSQPTGMAARTPPSCTQAHAERQRAAKPETVNAPVSGQITITRKSPIHERSVRLPASGSGQPRWEASATQTSDNATSAPAMPQ